MNFDRQVGMLKRAVRHLLEYAQGDQNAGAELERVAASHQGLGLDENQIRRFVNALIELAVARDPQAVTPEAAERLRSEWHQATEVGVSRFVEIIRSAPRPSEIVVPSPVARAQ